MGRFFGTDGVRGCANREPLTPTTIAKLGMAIAAFLRRDSASALPPRVLVARDTRRSGYMVQSALVAGLTASGSSVALAGVLPTPAVSYLTPKGGFTAGLVISASHNPFTDNGIKVFSASGRKLDTEEETAIEALMLDPNASSLLVAAADVGTASDYTAAVADYADFLLQAYPLEKKPVGIKVVLDCANGAAGVVAPTVFTRLGAIISVVHASPDGENINRNCGSQHTEALAQAVVGQGAACGFAFDGDSDRVIAVDAAGRTLTGDQMLTLCGIWFRRRGRLTNNLIVRTVMSNQGMTNALRERGIDFISTDVGDKFVAEAMEKSGAAIGGEDSGHIIFGGVLPTGDGILTALHILAVMVEEDKPLAILADQMEVLPQVLISVPTAAFTDFLGIPAVAAAIRQAQLDLGVTGRLLVRYSGTQTLCRVMVEAPNLGQARGICQMVADVIAKELG